MWNLITHFLTFAGGMSAGVVLMCLLQAGKQADEQMEEMSRRVKSMSMDATKELFEHIELFGKPALFTNSRIDVSTVPLDFYCYDLRGSDSDPGRPVTLERHVGINPCRICIDAAKGEDSRKRI